MSQRLLLETMVRPYDGRVVLYFPYIAKSDRHKGSKMYRAKRDCQMEDNTFCDQMDIVGDDWDGEALIKKKTDHIGAHHRQQEAHLHRKADNGVRIRRFVGNHEHGIYAGGSYVKYDEDKGGKLVTLEDAQLPRRNLVGKKIYGIEYLAQAHYTDPAGRIFRVEHGHLHDDHIFKTAEARTRWYRVGNFFNEAAAEVDEFVHEKYPQYENFSVAAPVKKFVKEFINGRLGIRRAMAEHVDRDDSIHGAIYGHSHMSGFQRTQAGKMLMNSGSATDHVEALVHDRNGAWAVITWHKDCIDVEQEGGQTYTVNFADLGLGHFSEPPQLIEDVYTQRADRIIRNIIRMWPSKDRQKMATFLRENEEFFETIHEVMASGNLTVREYNRYMDLLLQVQAHYALPVARRPRQEPLLRYDEPEFIAA